MTDQVNETSIRMADLEMNENNRTQEQTERNSKSDDKISNLENKPKTDNLSVISVSGNAVGGIDVKINEIAIPQSSSVKIDTVMRNPKKDDKFTYSVTTIESDEDNTNLKCINLRSYRENDSDSSDSDSSSTVSEDNNDSDNVSLSDKSEIAIKKRVKSVYAKGELSFEDLPPIEDLKLTVEENKCKPVGSVMNIVDAMVVVQSFPNTPPLDIDTVLFLERGQRALGKIFDVFGPVQEPLYCVRFNSQEHIKDKNIIKEMVVYCAPQTEYTSYVHTSQLLNNKGSDASWIDNNEPPTCCIDFSDDEAESKTKSKSKKIGSKRANASDNDLFVKKMNQRNLELTAKRRKEDEVAKQHKRSSQIRRVISNTNNSLEMVNMNSQSCFSPQFTDNYKLKTRTFTNSDQTRLGNFHHNPNGGPPASHCNKFDPATRSVNFLIGGFSSPTNFTFPPQHFLCSSARQLPPPPPPNPQNYLTMYSRPPMHSPTAAIPQFSTFSSPSIPPMPSFPPQPPPPIHPSLPLSMHHPPMTQFANFNPLPAPPLPSSLPQPNFFPCADAPSVHQSAFISLNVRPNISQTFHPPFALPPPPPSAQQRDTRSDRRTIPPSLHSATNSFYPNSPYNS